MRASIDGAVKLRKDFEKLREQGKRHSRTDSQNRALNEEAGSSSNDSNGERAFAPQASQLPTSQTTAATASATQRESITSTAETTWEGPPNEELGDEEIDWEFWGDVMSNYQSVARNHPRQLSRAIQAGIPQRYAG